MGHTHQVPIQVKLFIFFPHFDTLLQVCSHFHKPVLSAFNFFLLAHLLHRHRFLECFIIDTVLCDTDIHPVVLLSSMVCCCIDWVSSI